MCLTPWDWVFFRCWALVSPIRQATATMLFLYFLGMTAGIGSGLMRDMMTDSTPLVLRKHIYAVASLAGTVMRYGMLHVGSNGPLSTGVPALTVFIIRMLATRFKWNFSRAPH